MTDHDLLVVIHTKLERALVDLADHSPRIAHMEDGKLDRDEAYKLLAEALNGAKVTHDDHELRLRSLEKVTSELLTAISTMATKIATWGSAGLVALGIAEFLANKYF